MGGCITGGGTFEGDSLDLTGCCPNRFSLKSKTFFDKSKACSRRFENSSRLTAALKQIQSAFLALR
jgi:hypothetical protein